jgi:hypothetical protein
LDKAQPIGPIPSADAPTGALQGPRYKKFKSGKNLTDLPEKK